jgi:hypothetical protein
VYGEFISTLVRVGELAVNVAPVADGDVNTSNTTTRFGILQADSPPERTKWDGRK